jgi:EAL domain-containing protein (putative c-di-GMP-specific phosphodiesterase class I)/GGDEF domain-containing protein
MDGVKSGDGLWDWNLVTQRVHFSPRWLALLGIEDHEVCNSADELFRRVHPEDIAQVSQELDLARKGDRQAFEFRHRLRHNDGSFRRMVCRGVVVRDEAGHAIRLTGSHIDETMEGIADPLTGLPSHALLVDRLARALDRYSRYGNLPFALLLVGLGRSGASGPQSRASVDAPLLTAVARRLETCLRMRAEATSVIHEDDLVARLTDDHFAILLEGLREVGDSKVVADRILAELQSPVTLSRRQVYVSASIGIAVSVTGYTSAEAMLRDAETALHRARVLGGGRSEVFDTAVVQSEETALRLERDMPAALERDEFSVVYQPIVSLTSHQIVGFEALVRWHHPAAGVIAPADFIPAAERTGFIVPLGRWVMRQACAQLNTWQDTIPSTADLWISVNLSGVQLKHATLVDEIASVIRECNVGPRALVLELTEGVACENPMAVRTILMQLRAMGVRISIDDFGTGYSSLSYLQQLPLDALKVDRSFVRSLGMQDESAAIVATMTSMARQLGLHVVAEGIENEEQLPLLRSLNCQSGQGYLFARPLEVDVATAMLREGVPLRSSVDSARALVASPGQAAVRLSTRSLRGRWVALATGTVIVLATAGVSNRFLREARSTGRSVGAVRVENAASKNGERQSTSSPGGSDTAFAEKITAGGGTPRSAAGQTENDPPAVARQSSKDSFQVRHLHRLGSCLGRLELSHSRLLFTPEDATSKDTVRLAREEFRASLTRDTLTVKSNSRTYRFTVLANRAMADARAPLRELTETMARFR